MNHKTRNGALKALREYEANGVTFRYKKSGRWNWATEGSPLYVDILATLNAEDEAILNPTSPRPMYRIPVDSVKFSGKV